MIDWIRTAELHNKNVYDMKCYLKKFPRSDKKVFAICDICKKERMLVLYHYRKVCASCIRKGEDNPFWGKHHTQETKDKISENNTGYHHTQEAKDKIGKANIGKIISNKTRNNMIIKQKILGIRRRGCHHSQETKDKMSVAHRGENHWNWQGGISFGKYCRLFNEEFKTTVRDSYNNRCFLCGKSKEQNGKNLDVHHVNYDKSCLCTSICEFVPLCISCHSKTTHSKRYYEDVLMNYLYPDRYFIIDI